MKSSTTIKATALKMRLSSLIDSEELVSSVSIAGCFTRDLREARIGLVLTGSKEQNREFFLAF